MRELYFKLFFKIMSYAIQTAENVEFPRGESCQLDLIIIFSKAFSKRKNSYTLYFQISNPWLFHDLYLYVKILHRFYLTSFKFIRFQFCILRENGYSHIIYLCQLIIRVVIMHISKLSNYVSILYQSGTREIEQIRIIY